jgi:thiol-disulfide isomerase/thioredoxin
MLHFMMAIRFLSLKLALKIFIRYKLNGKMNKLFFTILLFCQIALVAQVKTIVTGSIENPTADSIELIIDKTYLSQKANKYKIPVKQNQFNFEFTIERHQLADLNYAGQTTKIYIEPEDKLDLKFKAGNLPESIFFSGKGAPNNTFLKKFNEQFPADFSSTAMEEKMKSSGVDQFEMLIYDNKAKQKTFYSAYTDRNQLTDMFKKYVEDQIKYTYLNFLLAYPVVNANKSNTILTVAPLPKVMVDVIDKNTVNDEDAMASESYRNYLVSFVTYFGSELNGFKKFTDFTVSAEKKYVVATDNLKGTPRLYYLTRFLLETGEKVNPETVKRIYTQMEKTSEYSIIINEKLGKWMKTKSPKIVAAKTDNSPSDIKLQGFNGKDLSFADFKGKVIYVDFWASWCGPCRQQFPYSKELHDKLSDKQKKEVVFLYISIDNTEEIWKNSIKELKLEGEHALSPGGWNSTATKHFQINSIPRYMLIDKKGNVVNPNASRPSEENTLQDILELLK